MKTLLTQSFNGDRVHKPRTQAAAVVAATVHTSGDRASAGAFAVNTMGNGLRAVLFINTSSESI